MTEVVASDSVRIRALGPGDLPAAQALSAAVDWPHRLEDWQFVYRLGQCWAAEESGRLVGTAMGWAYGPTAGALGMVITVPAMQGRGIGRRLVGKVLSGQQDRAVSLHATEAGLVLYESCGFVRTGLVRQHQGTGFVDGLMPLPAGERIRPIGRSDLPVLTSLDAAAGGWQRAEAIRALLALAETVVLDRSGEAIGFAPLRRFGRGYAIGPVVAPDATRARALIAYWVGIRHGQFLRIDVPEESGLCPWLQELGLVQVDTAIRMVRGPGPPAAKGVSGFALLNQAMG